MEGRALKESEGQSEGEEGGISGSSLPISCRLGHIGDKGLLCLFHCFARVGEGDLSPHSFFLLFPAWWTDISLGSRSHDVMQLQMLRLWLGDVGRGAVGWCFEMAPSPQGLAEM